MANKIDTYQQLTSFSVPRESFTRQVVINTKLTKEDYVVLCLLLTKLNGWNRYDRYVVKSTKTPDPRNFTKIHMGSVARTLHMEKKRVKQSIEHLVEIGVLEAGSSDTVKQGYRFTF